MANVISKEHIYFVLVRFRWAGVIHDLILG